MQKLAVIDYDPLICDTGQRIFRVTDPGVGRSAGGTPGPEVVAVPDLDVGPTGRRNVDPIND